MLFPALADRAMQPLVALGARLSQRAEGQSSGIGSSLLLGAATGLLWAPCAGPILGLVLTGAALGGANAATTLLLLAYAAGAATSLGLALLVGGRLFRVMRPSLGIGQWVRRAAGGLVLVAVGAIALGVDTGFLSRASIAGTTKIEQGLLDRFRMAQAAPQPGATEMLTDQGPMPPLDGAVQWLNSPPLTRESLKGKVVLVDFWTYSCINCLRALPYVRAWAEKYRDDGLVVIGVHAPEFAFEKDVGNVRRAVRDLGITYPVAIDNDYAIWRAFHNEYWPAHYFIDAKGRIRHHHFGEGDYAGSERVIQALLAEVRPGGVPHDIVAVNASGAQAAAGAARARSPETYLGYARARGFVSPGGAKHDLAAPYQAKATALNDWGLGGVWKIGAESAVLDRAPGRIVYRFNARDVHLVLGPGAKSAKIRFRVRLDGKPPAENHGVDTDAAGNGVVTTQRLYQLVRQKGAVRDRTFEIEFLDPGVEAYAFTFG
jgi:thiol-disulfide isomerase/thioredoxin